MTPTYLTRWMYITLVIVFPACVRTTAMPSEQLNRIKKDEGTDGKMKYATNGKICREYVCE